MATQLQNTFKNGSEPEVKQGFIATDPKIMKMTTGRDDVSEKLKRTPPQFEDAVRPMYNPGVKWMHIEKLKGGRFI